MTAVTSAYNFETTNFEEIYIALRKKEGRLLKDEEVRRLPFRSPNKEAIKEWKCRSASAINLINYLGRKSKRLNILEVGCGNGWLANLLSEIENAEVTGLDVNAYELSQARRVFNKSNLNFIEGPYPGTAKDKVYDIIVFAASIQYFKSFTHVMNEAIQLLNEQGEVHIIDSHFYNGDEVNNARYRSRQYFLDAGFPAMTDYYHHHDIKDLEAFGAKRINNSNGLFNKLIGKEDFPWYYISKNYAAAITGTYI